jgi:stearoyl-CoA desaturase (delta-9 desaturase)
MLDTPVQPVALAPEPVTPPAIPGSVAANARARRRERRIALVVVLTPLAALVLAVYLLWGHGVGPVDLGLLAGMYVLTMTGVMVGFHRHFAHNSFQAVRPVRAALGILGSMAGEGPLLYWAAVHRRHHAFSDRPGDPHSPHLSGKGVWGWLHGLWHSHVGWLFVHEDSDRGRYILDLLRDRLAFNISRLYYVWMLLGLAIPTVLGGLLTWSWKGAALGLLWGGLVRICLCQHSLWIVNSITHLFGSTPFRTQDESRNNFWIALPTFGESWHNNHHAFPYSALHGLRWWQIDPGGYVIRALRFVGLAWDVKVPPEHLINEARRQT